MTDPVTGLNSKQRLAGAPQARAAFRRGTGQAAQVTPQETEDEMAARVFAEVRRSLKIALLVAALGAALSLVLK